MSSPAPITPADRMFWLTRLLGNAVITRALQHFIAQAVCARIVNRLATLKQRFLRLAARIAAGSYKPRRSGPRRPPENPPNIPPRPKFGWVAALLPDAAQYRGHIRDFLQDPEVAKLVAVAPAEMARIVRPICWMLGVRPTNLPAPPRQSPPAPRPRRKPEASPPPPPPPAPTPQAAEPYPNAYPRHILGPSYRPKA